MSTMNKKPPEQKYPSVFVKVLLIGFSIMLAVSLVPAIINLSFNQTLYKTDFYADILQQYNFYDQVPELLYDTVIQSGTSSLHGTIIAGLEQEHIMKLILSILPSGWVKAQTDKAMISVMDFLNFKTDTLKINVDLQPIKDYLLSPIGKQAVIDSIENLPACSEDQLTQIMVTIQSGQGSFTLCNPFITEYINMEVLLDPLIVAFSNTLPAMIILPPDGQTAITDGIENSRVFQIYRNIRSLLPLFSWISLILALMIFLLSLRSLRWMSGSLGIPLVLAGLTSAIAGVWLYLSGGQGFSSKFTNASSGALQEFDALIFEIFLQGMHTAGQHLLLWCLGAFLLGLILLIVWSIAKIYIPNNNYL